MRLRPLLPGHRLVLCGLAPLGLLARLPRPVFAGDCDTWDPAKLTICQLDVAQYGIYETAASTIWLINRVLLGGAYWMDVLRHQFVNVVFTGAYTALSDAVGPLLGPMAILALMIGALALIALPITGSSGPINIRNVLLWCFVGPLLLAMSGPYLVQFESMRTDVGTLLFQNVSGGALALGSGPSNDMAAPTALYPSGECGIDSSGQPVLARHSQSDLPGVDEQVAALAWATAPDIHCPERALPMALYTTGYDNTGFVRYGGIQDLNAAERLHYLDGAKECINRLLLMILPAFVAALIALLNFVFACCTMMLWFSLPLGVLFSFFQTNANWFINLVQRGAGILKTSWLMSIMLGIFSSILLAAGQAGDGLRFSILTIIAGVFVVRFAFTSFGLFSETMATMTAVTGMGSGGPSVGNLTRGALGGAAGLALGAASGGTATAFTIAAAARQTGSGQYALAAGAGRFKPLMQLGEVAASMGMVSDEVASGLYAGYRSAGSGGLRTGRLAMQADARRLDTAGLAQDRHIERQLRRVERGSIVQQTARMVQGVKHTVPAGLGDTRSLRGAAETVSTAVNAMRGAISNPREAIVQARGAGGRALAALKRHALEQDRSQMQLFLDTKGRLRHEARVPAEHLPDTTQTDRVDRKRMRALLREGYNLQRNTDGTIAYWKLPDARSGSQLRREDGEKDGKR